MLTDGVFVIGMEGSAVRRVTSCGFLVFRRSPRVEFLLLRLPTRYDLPKGHVEAGESERECAARELAEETRLSASSLRVEEAYRFVSSYPSRSRRYGGETVEKQVVVFLCWLEGPAEVVTPEHAGHVWVPWAPPHRIERGTIDGALAAAAPFVAKGTAND
jgi:8-oxo-dGTP pyrophosphatase MutT (NUDIX family)